MGVTVTFDLEDSRASEDRPARFVEMSERFLNHIERRGISATVFIVGELARAYPDLVRRVAHGGHEVALHGLRHVALEDVGDERLRGELEEGRELLEGIVSAPVTGYRAPIFSLTPATEWAVEQIAAAGFAYSSSVLPAANPLHGWPGAPHRPFRWSAGLLELPCPVGGIGPLSVPFLGGVYLRYIPLRFARTLLRSLDASVVPWSYLHPYDIDSEEPFHVMAGAGWVTSRIAHMRRASTLERLDAVIAAGGGPGARMAEIAESLAHARLAPPPRSGG